MSSIFQFLSSMHVIPNQSVALTFGEEKLFMPSMSFQCPSCGRPDLELKEQCPCGFNADESFMADLENNNIDIVKSTSRKNVNEPKNNKDTKKVVIKEIDSWIFIFSPVDNCIYLGTPALQSFRLKLTLHDLEEILEFMYNKTGQEKTIRKLGLSVTEINDLIDKVHRMIEEKKSNIIVKFSEEELQEIVGLINTKLNT